jgi:hypothetical protein
VNIDESYEMKLLTPIKGTVGVKISNYLSALINNGVTIKDENGLVDKKFIAHFNHLISKGIITNSSGRVTLDSFGLEIGTNGHLNHWDCSDIIFVEPIALNSQVTNTINIGGAFNGNLQTGNANHLSSAPNNSATQWVLNHLVAVVGAIIAGVAVVLIISFLDIKT